MKKLIRKLTLISVFALILSTTINISYAQSIDSLRREMPLNLEDEDITARAEATMWFYRNNRKEKRLWSLTYGKWLTAWVKA